MEYKYQFSIIMSVYNVEEFIEEAVESVINQDIGFKNIQIVFVDDGSTDRSGEICDDYAKKYPDNIIVIHKENGGLSSARNEGMKHATGEYINFFDPDDILDLNTCSSVLKCIEHYANEDFSVVAIPLYFFDGKEGAHPTNEGKFDSSFKLINLRKDYKKIHTSCAASFIKNSVAKELLYFDDRLTSMEDAKALIPIFLRDGKYATTNLCKYNYRKRLIGGSSLSQSASSRKYWYIHHLKLFQKDVIETCMNEVKYVPFFVQYTLMYDLQWKLTQELLPDGLLDDDEITEYKNIISDILSYIDDKIIFAQNSMYSEHMYFALLKKYNNQMQVEDLLSTEKIRSVNIDFVEEKENTILIDGQIKLLSNEFAEEKIYYKINDSEYIRVPFNKRDKIRYLINEEVLSEKGFNIRIPITEKDLKIRFYYKERNSSFVLINKIIFKQFAPIGNKYKNSYFCFNEVMITANKNTIFINPYSKIDRLKKEIKFIKELFQSKKESDKKAALVRLAHNFINPFIRKPIWLISDKANRADDNGEAFFTYMNTYHKKDVNTVFVISKDSPDYERMKKIGKVVPTLSVWHKFLFTFASKTISAYSHIDVNNPYRAYYEPYRDYLNKCKFVFLQHGITQNDVTAGLNRYNKNISLFITSANDEHEYILNMPFYYEADKVSLSGLPRYDRLYNDSKKIITIAPTWRSFLFNGFIVEESRWIIKDGFEESDFYKFFINLINDRRIHEAAKKYGYKIQFFPHSIFFPYIDKFTANSDVTIKGQGYSYRTMFAESDLLVTDYSSIAFDFAYLRKPVIYTQFDYEKFYGDDKGYKPGYYHYDKKGFGEVEYTLEDTVSRIVEYMENNCKLKDKYRERIDKFFAYNDKSNCQRVYEKIMELEKNR